MLSEIAEIVRGSVNYNSAAIHFGIPLKLLAQIFFNDREVIHLVMRAASSWLVWNDRQYLDIHAKTECCPCFYVLRVWYEGKRFKTGLVHNLRVWIQRLASIYRWHLSRPPVKISPPEVVFIVITTNVASSTQFSYHWNPTSLVASTDDFSAISATAH